MNEDIKKNLIAREREDITHTLSSLADHIDDDTLLEIGINAFESQLTGNDRLKIHTELLRVLAMQEALAAHRKKIKSQVPYS